MIITDAGSILRIMAEIDNLIFVPIKTIDASLKCADPEEAVSIFEQRENDIFTQTIRISRIMKIMSKLIFPAIEFIDAIAEIGADPQDSGMILIKRKHLVAAEAIDVRRIMLVPGKLIVIDLEAIQSRIKSSDPELVAAIFQDRHHLVGTEAVGILRTILIMRELAHSHVKFIQTAAERADPEESIPARGVRANGNNAIIHQAFGIGGIMPEK